MLLNRCAEKLKCDGYEFMMYSTWYEKLDEIRRFMTGFPFPVPVFHCEKGIGEAISRNEEGDTEEALQAFEINCALAREIGAQTLVLHLWSGIHSDKDIAHNIALYADLRKISDRHGLTLTVENVVCNHEDPMTHLRRLSTAYPDIAFTFDTKMAEFHNQISDLYPSDLIKNIKHLHINDYKGGYKDWVNLRTLNIGDGQIDFNSFFEFIYKNNYQGDYTIEATAFDRDGVIHFDTLNKSLQKLQDFIKNI